MLVHLIEMIQVLNTFLRCCTALYDHGFRGRLGSHHLNVKSHQSALSWWIRNTLRLVSKPLSRSFIHCYENLNILHYCTYTWSTWPQCYGGKREICSGCMQIFFENGITIADIGLLSSNCHAISCNNNFEWKAIFASDNAVYWALVQNNKNWRYNWNQIRPLISPTL